MLAYVIRSHARIPPFGEEARDLPIGGSPSLGAWQAALFEKFGLEQREVECAEEVAVVAAVGAGAAAQPATLAKVLDVIGRAGVPVLASSQQDSNVAIVAAVPAGHAERAVAAIHDTFIKTQPASVRGRRPRRAELLAEAVRVG